MHPIVVVLLDGLGDRAHDVLGGRTGNEAARTPNLDALCARASCGVLYAVGPGRAPSIGGRALVDARLSARRVPGPRRLRGASDAGKRSTPRTCLRTRRCDPRNTATDGWWLTGRPDPERDAEDGRAARRALRGDRGRRAHLLAQPCLARRGGAARVGWRRPPRHRQRRVLSRPASGPPARRRSCPKRSARRARPRSGRAR